MSLVDRKKAEQLVHDLGESVHESFARVPERLEHEAVLLGVPCDEDEQMEIARMAASIFAEAAAFSSTSHLHKQLLAQEVIKLRREVCLCQWFLGFGDEGLGFRSASVCCLLRV